MAVVDQGHACAVLGGVSARAKLGPLPVEKVREQLEELAQNYRQYGAEEQLVDGRHKVAVLVLPGFFNPPHKAHMLALDAAREVVKSRGRIPVVAGFLAPVSDADASRRFGGSAISLGTRSSMCKLASSSSLWVDACSWGWTGAERIANQICQELATQLEWIGGVRWDFEAWWVLLSGMELRAHLRENSALAVCLASFESDRLAAQVWKAAHSSRPSSAFNSAVRARRYGRAAFLSHEPASEVQPVKLQSLILARDWNAIAECGWLEDSIFASLQSELLRSVPNKEVQAEPQGESTEASYVQDSKPLGHIISCSEECQPLKASSGKTVGLQYTGGDAAKASCCGGRKIIAHLCNDQGNGGRGFFQAIKKEWGAAPSRAYFEWHRDRGTSGDFVLGAVQIVKVSPLVEVANMVCQQGSKPGSKGPPVRYDAIERALHALGRHAAEVRASVHMPSSSRGGAGLEMEKMRPLVQGMSKLYGVTVYVYK